MFCLLYSPKQKIVKFYAQKQIGKSHVIDIFTSEDMENILLCIFQYLTLYYKIIHYIIYIFVLLLDHIDINFINIMRIVQHCLFNMIWSLSFRLKCSKGPQLFSAKGMASLYIFIQTIE
jgi:hypothetical protein